MRLRNYIIDTPLNENIIKNMLDKLRAKSISSVENTFKNAWLKISSTLKDKEPEILRVINSKFGTSFRSFDEISKIKTIKESKDINEGWTHYWELLKSEGFPTLAFYPALTAWMEIGKLLEPDQNVNWTKFGVYALFWVLLVSGKFVKSFYKWKKENPDQYFAERPKLAKKVGKNVRTNRAGFI
jgi:hypothetical protein